MTPSAERPPAERRFERGGEEFGRVLAFSDGMFAIAMTLLVVGITVPVLADADSVGELADALNGISESIISFFISFAVIGRYWLAHHQLFSLLRAFDPGLIGLNLVYLGLIAFLPFPTALLGTYFDNPLAVGIYAVSVAVISGLEVVLLRHAYRHRLLTKPMSGSIYRWGRNASTTPVVFFLISVPVAFLSSEAALACWLLTVPAAIWVQRQAPPEVEQFFA